VFVPRFGFIMVILSLLVSAIITGGVGPWLPYQMFTAGWMGMSAGWIGHFRFWIFDFRFTSSASAQSKIQNLKSKIEVVVLCVFGAVWGFVYGAIMNLWFWPFQAGDPAQSWQAGLTFVQGIQRYLAFYLATSFIWDVFAAIGNVALLALLGAPTLKVLQRFKNRFLFSVDSRRLAADRTP
jgi:energy-coupling factor transport system substrate-specific component